MPYTKTEWKDKIKDSAGNTIQEGTPLSAGNLNKIESGIEDAHKQLEQAARETVSLPYGTSVINSPDGSALDVEIQGRTLISMGNSPLEGGKKYVLADPKTSVVIDGTTYSSVSKFEGKNARPSIIRTTNFEGKTSGITIENPHIAKWLNTGSTTLVPPNNGGFQENDAHLTGIKSLDGAPSTWGSRPNVGEIAQHLFSFNLIEEVERKIGKIPSNSLADKVLWLKNNLSKITFNWHGGGNSAGGDKATLNRWEPINSSWISVTNTTTSTIAKLSAVPNLGAIDSNGFVHFLANAEASDGITRSLVRTDYVELTIELKADANFYEARIPLYEVSQSEYDKVLVDWDAVTVQNRYPAVEGIKPLKNPCLIVSGDNLLPPFKEWRLHANAENKIITPYELEIGSKGSYQVSDVYIDCIPGKDYTFSAEMNYPAYYDFHWLDANGVSTTIRVNQRDTFTFSLPANARQIRVVANHGTEIGKFRFKNPILTLGAKPKLFKPQDKSYLFVEAALHGINNDNDVCYQEGGRWKVLKKWDEIILEANIGWKGTVSYTGYKRVYFPLPVEGNISGSIKLLKYQGTILNRDSTYARPDVYFVVSDGNVYITVSNTDTGFLDTYSPTLDELKAYFNGWKAKSVDSNNKPTAWVSVIDGTDAPTQTLAYVSANKASGYTGYRLLYQLTIQKVIDITDKVEGALIINGQTQISVESGIIIREKVASPTLVGNLAFINRKAGDSNDNPLNYRTLKILNIYKGTTSDFYNWSIEKNFLGHGLERAVMPSNLVDPTANYYVTYLVLDKEKLTTNPLNVLATYNTSLRSTVNDISAKLSDVSTLTSIQERYLYKLLLAAKANGWSV
ncbi:hypothetical protein ACTHAL_001474 [Priestia flexa]|uniref:hypothetical protein n=1 Tax=Priestia flexa TaxID=86664 RepID=UPI003F8782B4